MVWPPRLGGRSCTAARGCRLQVVNAVTRKLPFFVSQTEDTAEAPREELRLKHRVLDLRWVMGATRQPGMGRVTPAGTSACSAWAAMPAAAKQPVPRNQLRWLQA